MKRALIVPVYKNETSLPDLIRVLEEVASNYRAHEFETVFVVDGSPDRSYLILKETLPAAKFCSRILLLSRNYGSFAAIRSGLEAVEASVYAFMAADLQEPPELVVQIFEKLTTGDWDLVVGSREDRDDPFMSKLFSTCFWGLYRMLVESQVPRGGVDVFGCNHGFKTVLLRMGESNTSLIGQIFWLGFRRTTVGYARVKRKYGKSTWSFRRKVRYFSDSIFSFTDLPIRLLLAVGFLGISLSVVLGAVALIVKYFGGTSVPGYTAIIIAILFFGAINLFGLGIVGAYTWRAYENTKQRPAFVVASHEAYDGVVNQSKSHE